MSNKENKEKKNVTNEKDEVTMFFVQRINDWLEKEMEKDPLFAETVRSKPHKTVKGACNYVLSVAKKTRQAGWDDDEVFGMVKHFFDEDDLKDPGNQGVEKIIVSGHIDLSESEKAKAMEQAKEEFKKEMELKAIQEEKLRKEKEMKAAEERKKRLEAEREKAATMQQDLFGGL